MAYQPPNSNPGQDAPTAAPTTTSVTTSSAAPIAIVEHGRYNFRAAAVVGLIVGVVDVVIALRFLLKLLGGSTQSSFVNFINALSAPLVAPFHGIFGDPGSGANVFETAALVAIVVYALIGWGIVVLIRIITAPKGAKPATS